MKPENLYVQKKEQWLKLFYSVVNNKKVHQEVFLKYYRPEKIPEMKSKTQKQFEKLLPDIPDFGMKKFNIFSRHLVNTALSLAFYRVLKAEGVELRTVGKILFEISEVFYSSLGHIRKFIMRRLYFSSLTQKKFKKILKERENNVDPEDYHCTFVEGDKKNLLWGFNYTNCAGLHFLKHHNALELAPYLCLCDYPMYRGIKLGFNRTQNLAIGGTMCAFRFYRNYPTPRGWPPEEVEEYKSFEFTEN
jgi:hypothetical protein